MSAYLRPRTGLVALLLTAAVAAAATGALAMPGAAAAVTPRASYNQVIQELMCVACHEPLAVAQSPESYSERQYVRDLIAQGDTDAQIKRAMVASYTSAVLALPPARGFNLTVYVLPPVLVVLGVAGLVFTIPKWRRRARQLAPLPSAEVLAPEDADRLDEDLARRA